MAWWKQLALSAAVAVAALVAWIAWMPEARPLLDRVGVWPVLERSGALGALAVVGITPAEAPAPGGGGGPPGAGGGAPGVVAVEVVAVQRNATISAIGTGQALRSVAVTPDASGRLVEILVQPGQRVEAGSILARLDAAGERIAVDRASVMLEEARDTAERLQRLQGTGSASEVQIREAERAVRTAELAQAQAELDLRRRDIRAPIDGAVGFVPAEVGNQVTTASEITRIDDRSVLLVSFLVPERHVPDLAPGVPVTARPLGRTGTALEGRIRNIDSRVQVDSRSLTVEAEIANPDDTLRAGMAFAIAIELPGEDLPAVDPLAIQWGRQGAFVWSVRDDDTVTRTPIRIVQRAGDLVLLEGALEPGDRVVREGVQTLREGGPVDLRDTVRPGEDEVDGTAAGAPPATVTTTEG